MPPRTGVLHLAIFILTSLRAVDVLATAPNKPSEVSSVQEELAIQERNTTPRLNPLPTKADGSPSRNRADETQSFGLTSWDLTDTISKPDLILSNGNNAPCSPVNHRATTEGKLKRRKLKERRGATPNPESFCPKPGAITTDTDTPAPKADGQQPQTEKGQEQGPAAKYGLPQSEEFKWPNMFKIPTGDGDSPACFEATNGLMPVGVCENSERQPEPSRWDVFMQFNRYMDPRAWKLVDSTLGAFFFSHIFFRPCTHNLDHYGFTLRNSTFCKPPSSPLPKKRKKKKTFHFRPIFLCTFFVFSCVFLIKKTYSMARNA